jgi:hypothetical protein
MAHFDGVNPGLHIGAMQPLWGLAMTEPVWGISVFGGRSIKTSAQSDGGKISQGFIKGMEVKRNSLVRSWRMCPSYLFAGAALSSGTPLMPGRLVGYWL